MLIFLIIVIYIVSPHYFFVLFCFNLKFFSNKDFKKIEIPSGLGGRTVPLEDFACALEVSVPGGDQLPHLLFGLVGAVFLVPLSLRLQLCKGLILTSYASKSHLQDFY